MYRYEETGSGCIQSVGRSDRDRGMAGENESEKNKEKVEGAAHRGEQARTRLRECGKYRERKRRRNEGRSLISESMCG